MVTDAPKRRWCQFSLKTLLIVTTLATLSFGGWVQYRRQRAQENRERVAVTEEAVTELQELVGKIYFEYEERRPQTWLEEQFDDPGDEPVGVHTFSDLDLQFADDDTNDAELEHVIELLEQVNGLESIEYVFLDNTNITDAGLKRLGSLPNLHYLALSGTKVTDEGLKHLEGLANFRELYLMDTKITDAGLEHLKVLTKLKILRLNNTKVTDEGVTEFMQAIPKCQVWH